MLYNETQTQPMPIELINIIISHSNLFTLLKLRLVSKGVKAFVDVSERLEYFMKDVRINLHSNTLPLFLESVPSLPVSNFYINVSPPKNTKVIKDSSGGVGSPDDIPYFYIHNQSLKTFIELFGSRIQKLRVSGKFCCTLDSELEFFRSLINLKELQICTLESVTPEGIWKFSDGSEIEVNLPRLPFTKPNEMIKSLAVLADKNSGEYLLHWIKMCPCLNSIQLPRSMQSPGVGSAGYQVVHPYGFVAHKLEQFECYPYILRLGFEGHLQHLKQLDMNNQAIRMSLCTEDDLLYFQEMVSTKKIRLIGVPPSFLLRIGQNTRLPSEAKINFRRRIKSGVGISESLKNYNFSKLQTLTFHSACNAPDGIGWELDYLPIRPLPALRKICLHFGLNWGTTGTTKEFLNSVFRRDEPWINVTDVNVTFYDAESPVQTFWPDYMGTSVPNLTRLVLSFKCISTAEFKQLLEVLSKKPLLEELDLRTGSWIPEDAFFGTVEGNPPEFLRFMNLQKLRLAFGSTSQKSLPEKESMGDRMLEFLSRMSLTHLEISGEQWKNVTEEGLKALVEGSLGQSVQHIKFRGAKESLLDATKHRYALEKVCYRNLFAGGLTSMCSFEEFKQSKKALLKRNYTVSKRRWNYRWKDLNQFCNFMSYNTTNTN